MIDPELKPFLEMWQRAWSGYSERICPPRAARCSSGCRPRRASRCPAGVVDEERFVASPGALRARAHLPRASGPVAPCLVYMHGGGWMQGSPETHDAITVGIVEQTGYTVISVDYALAPEVPFPAAVQDCEAVVRWAFANAPELRPRPQSDQRRRRQRRREPGSRDDADLPRRGAAA